MERQKETETENNDEEEESYVPAENPCTVTPCKSLALSESDSSIGDRLVTAVELTKPELCAPRVAIETPLTDEREEGEVAVAEQLPDLTTIDTADSFTRIKELVEGICPESTLGWVFMKKGLSRDSLFSYSKQSSFVLHEKCGQ